MSSEIQASVEKIARLNREIDEQTAFLEKLLMDLAYAATDAEMAYARTYMGLEGSVENRKQQAILDAAQERQDERIFDAKVKACKARIQQLQTEVDCERTVNAALRSQFQAEPFGQYT